MITNTVNDLSVSWPYAHVLNKWVCPSADSATRHLPALRLRQSKHNTGEAQLSRHCGIWARHRSEGEYSCEIFRCRSNASGGKGDFSSNASSTSVAPGPRNSCCGLALIFSPSLCRGAVRLSSTLGSGHTSLQLVVSELSNTRRKHKDLLKAHTVGELVGNICHSCTWMILL